MIKTQYVTSDGTVFENYVTAVDYENANTGLIKHIKDYLIMEHNDDVGFAIIEFENVRDYIIRYWEDIKGLMARGEF